jgi:NACalpha-BTF3-like transcription factor
MAKAAAKATKSKSTKPTKSTKSAKPAAKAAKPKLEITADMIKAVRKETRAGTLDCKDALLATGGDISKAILMVREHGKITPKKVWV